MPVSNKALTPHEAVKLHELLSMNVMDIKRLKTAKTILPEGSNLDSFIDTSITAKEQQLDEFKQFFSSGVLQ